MRSRFFNKMQALDQRGRGDEAVERVFVMQRQSGQRLDMGYLNRKKLDAVKCELRGKHNRERFIEPDWPSTVITQAV